MEDKGVTPSELAKRLDLSADYVRNIISGHRRLKRSVTLRHDIARTLGVPRDWIEAERPDPDRLAS